MNVVIYPKDGHIAVCTPAGTKTAEEIVSKVVPEGVEYKIVDDSTIPPYFYFFNALTFSDPVTVDLDKAKEIVHVQRRSARDAEFAPYDDIIAKQIPGADADAAEAERVKIRAKYEEMQNTINSSTSVSDLYTLLLSLKA